MKLNVGCGRDRVSGWEHIDRFDYGDNVVFNLDDIHHFGYKLPYDDNSVDEIKLTHVLEHLRWPLPVMEELWRVARPDCVLHFAMPFAGSDAAIEDQTHVREYTYNSVCYFSQPVYCNADYGYRGDWHCGELTVTIRDITPGFDDLRYEDQLRLVRRGHYGIEMFGAMRAIKPARPQKLELVRVPAVRFVRV